VKYAIVVQARSMCEIERGTDLIALQRNIDGALTVAVSDAMRDIFGRDGSHGRS
jgi:hypothetical protein